MTCNEEIELFTEILGNEMRRTRKKAGLTQGQVARRMGVVTSTVARWEGSPRYTIPPLGRFFDWVKVIGISPSQFIADVDKKMGFEMYLRKGSGK